jgi:AraC-like DNA-binding protein
VSLSSIGDSSRTNSGRQTPNLLVISASLSQLERSLFGSGFLITMDRRIEIVINQIETQKDCAWDVGVLARLVHLSPSRLRHLFKEETGTTLVRHLRDLRVRRGEFLVRTTFLTVKEVAGRLGMTTPHFVKEFKRMYGVRPSSYRVDRKMVLSVSRI